MQHPIRLVTVALLFALAPTTAQAATQSREDPSDAPTGASGKADLRRMDWNVAADAATLSIAVDESAPSEIAVHVLIDADSDGIADHEVVATRNADGVKIDVLLRDLDRTLSTGDCQDLAGKATGAQGTVNTTIQNGIESFTFSFDPTLVPGNLVAFRWAAFRPGSTRRRAGRSVGPAPRLSEPGTGRRESRRPALQ